MGSGHRGLSAVAPVGRRPEGPTAVRSEKPWKGMALFLLRIPRLPTLLSLSMNSAGFGGEECRSFHFKFGSGAQTYFRNSDRSILASFRMACRVPLSSSGCRGTVMNDTSLVRVTWLPFCLSTLKP